MFADHCAEVTLLAVVKILPIFTKDDSVLGISITKKEIGSWKYVLWDYLIWNTGFWPFWMFVAASVSRDYIIVRLKGMTRSKTLLFPSISYSALFFLTHWSPRRSLWSQKAWTRERMLSTSLRPKTAKPLRSVYILVAQKSLASSNSRLKLVITRLRSWSFLLYSKRIH